MSWTDERIDSLKRLWGDGLSASQIATHLGGVSRNAVIGKVHRLKLESRIKPPADALKREALLEGAVMPAAVMESPSVAAPTLPRLVISTPAPAPAAPPAPPAAPRVVAAAIEMPERDSPPLDPADEIAASTAVVEAAPATRNLTLIQLSERTCKWPLGDPLSDEFRFCGNHSRDASPYCAYHARMAFQPASERRRVR